MKEVKNKRIVAVLAVLAVLGIVGGSIAYFSSSNTFQNVFGTKTYRMEVVETFESPDDWTPGTTTNKRVVATNKGDVDAAVRVSYTESWKDASNNPLALTDANNHRAAIVNFADDYSTKWTKSTENGTDYYYYKTKLAKDASTTSLLKSVTFNPEVQINTTDNCVALETNKLFSDHERRKNGT